jgi:hypothetical protein
MPVVACFVLTALGQPAQAEGIIVQGSVKTDSDTDTGPACERSIGSAEGTLPSGQGYSSEPGNPGPGGGAPVLGEGEGDDDGSGSDRNDVPSDFECENIGYGIVSCQPPEGSEPTLGGEPGDDAYVEIDDADAACSSGGGSSPFGLLFGVFALGLIVLRNRFRLI